MLRSKKTWEFPLCIFMSAGSRQANFKFVFDNDTKLSTAFFFFSSSLAAASCSSDHAVERLSRLARRGMSFSSSPLRYSSLDICYFKWSIRCCSMNGMVFLRDSHAVARRDKDFAGLVSRTFVILNHVVLSMFSHKNPSRTRSLFEDSWREYLFSNGLSAGLAALKATLSSKNSRDD